MSAEPPTEINPRLRKLLMVAVIAVMMIGLGARAWQIQSRANAAGEERAGVAELAVLRRSNGHTPKETKQMDDSKLAAMKDKLTPEQYNICFLKGTEPPGSGKYNKHYEPGAYHCVACGELLFKSETKFDSGTGWPSFWDGAEDGAIAKHTDSSHGMTRTEVTCANCGAHLGHVFDDGPAPTGQRYCINSLALEFVPEAEEVKEQAKDGDG